VQLRLPWFDGGAPQRRQATPVRSSAPRSIRIDGCDLPIEIARHRLARRYVVRVTADGGVRLTVPRSASIAAGLAFAARQADWIARQWDRQRRRAAPWVTGTRVRWRGDLVDLVVSDGDVQLGSMRIRRESPSADVRSGVELHLRALAERELSARCAELATETQVKITGVSVRNQQSRWGACSARRVITLNWRLVQMPPNVSDYIVFHELMHVRQPNHSRRFWREVESVCPWWRDAERWLRRHGREIL
jgi:predicted metal-dependent hydrolase